MKKTVLISLLLLVITINTQAQCGSRYVDTIFTSVTKTLNKKYGNNITIAGANKDLFVDIYEPTGDTFEIRPLIILAHGGSFIGGSRTSPDVVELCNNFAKRGYVTASISYRLYDGLLFPLPDSLDMYDEAIKAVTDYKAAIRYFYKDRSSVNLYKIDTTQIFIGGVSAGAITAVNVAYIDNVSETAPWIQSIIASNGGLNGTSGNSGYSSKIKAIISVCGAVGNDSWIDANDEPIISFHGTADDVVPFGYGCATIAGICIANLDGSSKVHARAASLGITNFLRIHYGQGHVPFATNPIYMDTTITDIVNFIAPMTLCNPTYIGESSYNLSFDYAPNPASGMIYINLEELKMVQLLDITGSILLQKNENNIDVSRFSEGFYMVLVEDKNGKKGIKKLVIKH